MHAFVCRTVSSERVAFVQDFVGAPSPQPSPSVEGEGACFSERSAFPVNSDFLDLFIDGV